MVLEVGGSIPLTHPIARLVMLRRTALCFVVSAAVACGAADDARARHLVLVTVDTHRGDHVLQERAGEPRLESRLVAAATPDGRALEAQVEIEARW